MPDKTPMQKRPQQFKPGNSGRPKGSPNKIPVQVNAMIMTALNEVGGVTYLVSCAKSEPKAFLALVGKLVTRVIESDNTHHVMSLADLLRSIPDNPEPPK